MNTEKEIAQAILLAQNLREASYSSVDGEYLRDMEECLMEACKKNNVSENMWVLLNLAMHWYNDIQLWAEDILNDRKVIDQMTPEPEVKVIDTRNIVDRDS
jgi:hypothetical protein